MITFKFKLTKGRGVVLLKEKKKEKNLILLLT